MTDDKQQESTEDESVESALQKESGAAGEETAGDETAGGETTSEISGGEVTEGEAGEEPKKKKVRSKKTRVVRRRKSKKEKERPLTGALRLAVESGKVDFGSRTAMAGAKARVFVLAGNAQPDVREKVMSVAKAAGIPVIEFEGSSVELGSVCGKPFPVSVLSVYDEGSSNLSELARKK